MVHNWDRPPGLLLRAWHAESFAWICTAELNRSWEQTNKTPWKRTRKPLGTECDRGEGDDQQYLKCTDCSRSLCTTCTLSTLELQCLQHIEGRSGKKKKVTGCEQNSNKSCSTEPSYLCVKYSSLTSIRRILCHLVGIEVRTEQILQPEGATRAVDTQLLHQLH